MTEETPDNLDDLIFRIVRDDVLEAGDDFTRTTSLQEAGLDSLSLTQLLLALEEETGVWIDEAYLTPEHLENVTTLVSCVREIKENS